MANGEGSKPEDLWEQYSHAVDATIRTIIEHTPPDQARERLEQAQRLTRTGNLVILAGALDSDPQDGDLGQEARSALAGLKFDLAASDFPSPERS